MKTRAVITMVGVILSFALAVVWGQEQPARSPVPDAAAQAAAEELIREALEEDYQKRQPEHRRTLAKKLLEMAAEHQQEPTLRYVSLREACRAAAEGADAELTLTAAETMALHYAVDSLSTKMQALGQVGMSISEWEDAKALAEAYLKVSDEAVAADDYLVAARALPAARRWAEWARETQFAVAILRRYQEVQHIRAAFDKTAQTREALKNDPDDPEANFIIGRFLCLVKHDWDAGLPLLVKGWDEELKWIAQAELRRPTSTEDVVKIGDDWWDLADSQIDKRARWALRTRAAFWYRQTLSDLGETDEQRVRARLQQMEEEALPPMKPVIVADAPPPPPEEKAPPPRLAIGLPPEIPEAWPIVFEDPLDQETCLEHVYIARGMYGGHVRLQKDRWLAASGINSNSAAWWDCPVGDTFGLSVEFKILQGKPLVWLCGPGYGISTALGYCLVLRSDSVAVWKEGEALGTAKLPEELKKDRWYRLDVAKNGTLLSVYINGLRVGAWRDPRPLSGLLHSFVALGASGGSWRGAGICYRFLSIRMPADVVARLQEAPVKKCYDPPRTLAPLPNWAPLLSYDFTQTDPSDWSLTQPGAIKRTAEGVVLSGSNARPRMWCTESIAGSFAVECEMSYVPGREQLGFHVMLILGKEADTWSPQWGRWDLLFPHSHGSIALNWVPPGQRARRRAATPQFVPVDGRWYTIRIERRGNYLRVFSNNGFLFEAAAPPDIPQGVPVYLGIGQDFGGSIVRQVAAWQIQ